MPRRAHTEITCPEAEPTAVIAEIGGVEAQTEAELEPASETTPSTAALKPPTGKLGAIHGQIAAPAGATIDDLVATTGWQPHTIRAAFSRLRRRGFPIALITDLDGRKAYRVQVRED